MGQRDLQPPALLLVVLPSKCTSTRSTGAVAGIAPRSSPVSLRNGVVSRVRDGLEAFVLDRSDYFLLLPKRLLPFLGPGNGGRGAAAARGHLLDQRALVTVASSSAAGGGRRPPPPAVVGQVSIVRRHRTELQPHPLLHSAGGHSVPGLSPPAATAAAAAAAATAAAAAAAAAAGLQLRADQACHARRASAGATDTCRRHRLRSSARAEAEAAPARPAARECVRAGRDVLLVLLGEAGQEPVGLPLPGGPRMAGAGGGAASPGMPRP
eukprot:SAG22_NODE_1185_length_5222_cov_123.827835_2_plen_267_part_00